MWNCYKNSKYNNKNNLVFYSKKSKMKTVLIPHKKQGELIKTI